MFIKPWGFLFPPSTYFINPYTCSNLNNTSQYFGCIVFGYSRNPFIMLLILFFQYLSTTHYFAQWNLLLNRQLLISVKLIWFTAQFPCVCQSRNAVSMGLQRSLRQFDGEFIAKPRRFQCDSTETALPIETFLNSLKKFCSSANPQRIR